MVRIAKLAIRIRTDIPDSELVRMLLNSPSLSWKQADLRLVKHSENPRESYDPSTESKYLRKRYGQSIF